MLIELAGQRFGRLAVLEKVGNKPKLVRKTGKYKRGDALWLCACDCGKVTVVVAYHLRSGAIQSCGCLHNEWCRDRAMPVEHHRKRKREYNGARYRDDPFERLKARVRDMLRKAIVRPTKSGEPQLVSLLGFSEADFRRHIERQFLDGMGWHNIDGWQIDHIVPLCTANTEGDVIALSQLPNLRPIWREDNLRKAHIRTHLL